MAQSEPIPRQAMPHTLSRGRALQHAWQKFKLFLIRSAFWSYERGSWQYDVILAVILAFIFLTPRAWFRDRPTLELSDLRHRQGVIEIGGAGQDHRYLVDARLVESMAPLKPEEAVGSILELRLNRALVIKSIEPLQDKNHVLLGYTVVVSP
jgi:hypothetical protein